MWKTVPGGKSLRQQVLEEFATCASVSRCLVGVARAGERQALPAVTVTVVHLPKRARGPRRIVA